MIDRNRLGRCYELSYNYIMAHPEYILVHGYITNIIPPYQIIDHAWCMKDDVVYDAVLEKEYKREIYESMFRAEIAKQYTWVEAMKMADKTETYGCWHEVKDLNLDKYYDDDRQLKQEYKEGIE